MTDKKRNVFKVLTNGFMKENPVLKLVLVHVRPLLLQQWLKMELAWE